MRGHPGRTRSGACDVFRLLLPSIQVHVFSVLCGRSTRTLEELRIRGTGDVRASASCSGESSGLVYDLAVAACAGGEAAGAGERLLRDHFVAAAGLGDQG